MEQLRLSNGITKDDVKLMFDVGNMFPARQDTVVGDGFEIPSGSISFDMFKKMFFPHLYLVKEEQQSDEDREVNTKKKEMKFNKNQNVKIMEERVLKLEKDIKIRLGNNFQKVRKAFLTLDEDYNGTIGIDDLLRYFGSDLKIDYNDLKKILKDKDSNGKGRLNYSDFSKWIGSTINQSEGFYFRHDSWKNPGFEKNLLKYNKNFESIQPSNIAANSEDLEAKVLSKIQFQWKTLRKAFTNLNFDKTGQIKP